LSGIEIDLNVSGGTCAIAIWVAESAHAALTRLVTSLKVCLIGSLPSMIPLLSVAGPTVVHPDHLRSDVYASSGGILR
jgi:hypothetical protein